MIQASDIPADWYFKPGYFITYLGDIYEGVVIKLESSDAYYILPARANDQYRNGNAHRNDHFIIDNGTYLETIDVIEDWVEAKQFELNFPVNEVRPIPTYSGKRQHQKLFVFGAGASAFSFMRKGRGAWDSDAMTPPLALDLFHNRFTPLIDKHKAIKPIIPRFERQENDIENILETEWRKIRSTKDLRVATQHIQLQLYLSDLLSQVSANVIHKHYRYNLFPLFIEQLFDNTPKDECPLFVSFNYDTILEHYLEDHFNFKYNQLDDYIRQRNEGDFALLKPHGSANWGWELDHDKMGDHLSKILESERPSPAEIFYDFTKSQPLNLASWGAEQYLTESKGARFTLNKDRIQIKQNHPHWLPALLLPFRDKDDFIMPYNHYQFFRHAIDEIEEMVLIGWKGNEQFFNRVVSKYARNLKSMTIVNPNVEEVEENLEHGGFDLSIVEVKHVKDFESYVLKEMNQ